MVRDRRRPFSRAAVALAALTLLLPAPVGAQARDRASEALAAVQHRIAPDRRLTVFDLSLERRATTIVVRGKVESPKAREQALAALKAVARGEIEDHIAVLPAPDLGRLTAGLVRVSVANIRGTPSHTAELVTQALMGSSVRVLKRRNGWYLVHTEPDGYLGWIEHLQLHRLPPDDVEAWRSQPQAIVRVPFTIARARASSDAPVVTDLVIGGIVRSFGTAGEWTEVGLPDGRRAFARAEDLQNLREWLASRSTTPEDVLATARLFTGVPYLWGGTSAKGFDCSGFVQTVMRLHGIELPRDADQQSRAGTEVPIDPKLSAAIAGDLLFFGAAATAERPERVTHVGIYLGDGEVIHASGLVRQSSLDPSHEGYEERLQKQLLHIRRVLPGS